jgi:hypothetical protein
MVSQKAATPVETGVQGIYNYSKILDSGFRWNDGKRIFGLFTKPSTLMSEITGGKGLWNRKRRSTR